MKKIIIHNLKGGVAKTTTAANFAYNLAKQGYRVLLADCDKQGNLSRLFGCWCYNKNTLADVLTGKCTATEAVRKTKYDNLDIISADINLLDANQQITRPDILKNALAPLEDNYDYCIFDCAPNIDMIILNILACADEIIVPVKMDGFAIDGVNDIMQQVENVKAINPALTLRGCLITGYAKDTMANADIPDLKERYGVFDTRIPYTKKVAESTIYQQVLDEFSPTCGAARGYRKFTAEYLEG